jgi:uncharacterized protein (DUF4415 family)
MAKEENTVRFTAEEMKAELAKAKRIVRPQPTDEEIERAAREDPDDDLSDDWSNAAIYIPITPKTGVYMRIDPQVLEFFRKDGPGYQTRINAVLRAYVEAQTKRRRTG